MTERVGEVLASKYRLEAFLGAGGMGEVYRAENELVGRKVAIKILKTEHAQNVEVVDRFLREAKAANLVRHPNVVDVLDIGKDERGTPFIVQELLTGIDLGRHLEARGGRLGLAEAVDLLAPIIDAVAEAHARDVVHRDIKPDNVFLAKAGTRVIPKLLDFGISKIRTANGIRSTEVGVMMGTPAYMPPEQVQGARDADARSDVWALGVMLFEVLSGRLPFAADGPAIFVAIATQDAPTLLSVAPEIAPDVSRVVERCLRRRPADRYPSAAELARDLRNVLDGIELEPTQRRSIPVPRLAEAPDLALPIAPPLTIALTNEKVARAPAPSSSSGPLPEAPDLALPPPRVSAAKTPAAPPPSSPALQYAPPSTRALPSPPPSSSHDLAAPRMGSRPDIPSHLPGMVLSPGAATSSRPVPRSTPSGLRPPEADLPADTSWIVGLGVVGLVAIGTTAVITTFAHRPEGFAVVRFLIGPDALMNTVLQSVLALVALALAGRSMVRSLRHWRGDLAGGRPGALLNAVVGGAFFFVAIQLARAAL